MRRKNGTGAITKLGYVSICTQYRYQYEHIRKAETALGKALPVGAQVHHADENKSNNENTNLVICPDQKYHRLLHRRTRAFDACGDANFLQCRYCKQYDHPSLLKRDGPRSFSHSECRGRHRRALYGQGRKV